MSRAARTVAADKHARRGRSAATAAGADWAIVQLAERQHGVISHEQLIALGLTRSAIAHRLAAGRLHRIHRGVYAVGRPSLSARGRQLAATLAYGSTAVLSHKSAGSLWELLSTGQLRVDVTVPGTSRQRQKHIRIHRARVLTDEDVAVVDGIPVTSLARTVVDLASVLRIGALERVVEQADRSGLLDPAAVERALGRAPAHRGSGRLRRLIAVYCAPVPTRSELERRFLELVLEAGLPRPRVNTRVAGLEVDFYWPQWRLVVELDGRAYHSDPRSFERDRVRDARLQRSRCRVLRVTHRRMSSTPAMVIEDIRALAALAGAG
jgi:very-short-patch-repair endonuclease